MNKKNHFPAAVLSYTETIIITTLMIIIVSCQQKESQQSSFTHSDSINIIQTVLNDTELAKDLKKSFGNEQLKLVANNVVRDDFQFWFSGQPVKIVRLEENNQEIHLKFPKQFYATIPMLKQITPDSVQLSLVFHAGNATALFYLKNNNEKWAILGRQYGKF